MQQYSGTFFPDTVYV